MPGTLKLILATGFLLVFGAPVALISLAAGGGHTAVPVTAPQQPTSDPHGAQLPNGRVLVVTRSAPGPDVPGEPLHGMLVSGPHMFASGPAVVLTDTQCQPDGHGVSHCLNRIRLASGQVIAVRHPHRMMEVACLSPGEHIMLRRA